MKRFPCFLILFFLVFFVSSTFAVKFFSLSDLPTDSEQARTRLSHLKNAEFIRLIPRPPVFLVMVSAKFWKKLSIHEKAGAIRDCLYFCRFYSQSYGTEFSGAILFNAKNPKEEYGYGNLKPGNIIVF